MMNIIAVDDEKFALMELQSAVKEALPDSVISCFDKPTAALDYAKSNQIDMAFLDIEMGGMNGLQLAKHLKEIRDKTNIIFVSGYSQYAVEAFALRGGGYLLKPISAKAVTETIENMRHPAKAEPGNRLRIQTFGNFEVFVDGKPLSFARTKTKELLAYIVSRQGAMCNNNEIAAVIWEGREDTASLKSLFRTLVADLTRALRSAGINDVIIKQWGCLGIATDKISCDLYDFCAGIDVNSYMGEFMTQYSWAEFTNDYLERMRN